MPFDESDEEGPMPTYSPVALVDAEDEDELGAEVPDDGEDVPVPDEDEETEVRRQLSDRHSTFSFPS